MKLRADRRVGLLLAGVMLLTLVSIGGSVVLPASDPSLDVKGADLTKEERAGMELYRSKGLWYCNTAYIRETSVDRIIRGSRPTKAEDIAGQSPVMLGLERTDPDGVIDASAVADACGVKLSTSELGAVDAFLETRVQPPG
jgi:hypothetical protein